MGIQASSIWFYDHAPSIGDSYAWFQISKSSTSLYQNLSVVDFDTAFYYNPSTVSSGSAQTSVPRSLGWHELKIVVGGAGGSAYIDGALLSTVPAMTSFDHLIMGGGQWRFRPNSTYVFDDFMVSSVPEPSTTIMMSVFALCGLGCALRRRWK